MKANAAATSGFSFLPEASMPNRKKTSEQVTRIEMMMRTMMIQVMPAYLLVTGSRKHVGSTYVSSLYRRCCPKESQQDRGRHGIVRSGLECAA